MPPRLRTLLVLGRVSNLPTVWSNCLAGWWLGGGGNFRKLPLLLLGVSALYTGGMYLNDAFDEDFDRLRRAERPIPSGKISAQGSLALRLGWLAAGIVLLLILRPSSPARSALLLALCIVHLQRHAQTFHRVAVADGRVPVLGLCHRRRNRRGRLERLADFLRRGAGDLHRGLSYRRAARKLARGGSILAAAAAARAGRAGADDERTGNIRRRRFGFRSCWCCGRRFARWRIFLPGVVNAGWIVSNLLAGIVFVDWLAVAPQFPRSAGCCIFLGAVWPDEMAAKIRAGDVK